MIFKMARLSRPMVFVAALAGLQAQNLVPNASFEQVTIIKTLGW